MSYITIQDQHPGRCHNYRHDAPDSNGIIPQRRCLEMDGHSGPCVFDPPQSRFKKSDSHYFVAPEPPKPWTPRKPNPIVATKVET